MLVNIINSYRDIVAICDAELIGKRFEEGKFQLDVKESFFGGNTPKGTSKKTEQEVIEIMQGMKKEDSTFNIVGERATNTAIKAGLINKDSIKTIQGIPFSLVLL